MHTGSSKPRGPKLPRRGPPGGPCPGDQRLQPPLFSRLSALSLGLSRQYEQQRDPLTLKHRVAEDTSAEADSCDPLKLRATHAPCSIHCVVLPTSLLSPAAGPAVPCYSAASVLRRVRHEKAAPKAICASMTTARGGGSLPHFPIFPACQPAREQLAPQRRSSLTCMRCLSKNACATPSLLTIGPRFSTSAAVSAYHSLHMPQFPWQREVSHGKGHITACVV